MSAERRLGYWLGYGRLLSARHGSVVEEKVGSVGASGDARLADEVGSEVGCSATGR